MESNKLCEEKVCKLVKDCLLDSLPDAIYLIDPKTSQIIYVNHEGCQALGMTREEVLYQSVLSLQEDVINIPQWSEIAQVIEDSIEPYLFIGRHKRKDGSVFPVEVRTSNVVNNGEHYFLSVARDITCRAMIDEELKGHQHSLWFALNEATDGIWEWNIQTSDLFVSPKLKQMLGYGPQEPVAHVSFWESNIHPDDIDRVLAILDDHVKGNLAKYEAKYRLRNRAGHYIWVHDRGRVSQFDADGSPQLAVGMVHNITEQVHLQQRLEKQASKDALTGAWDRRVCQEYIEKQADLGQHSDSHQFSILLLDIDHFKQVNDEFGHTAGDKVLKSFVELTQKNLSEGEILFRWGGEEFLILLPAVDLSLALTKAEELCRVIDSSCVTNSNGMSANLTISIGVASYPEHGVDMSKLIQSADIAMYRAKANGRNRVEVYKDN